MTNPSKTAQLERYTEIFPQEVLVIRAKIGDELDEILIFRGFSSSLMRPTAFDPDVPVLPEEAEILGIDRAESPYNAEQPRYIQQNLTWEDMQDLLAKSL
ncbi:MAG: hypothetical protein ACFBSC_03110 [Microcoleaceae cyanobacterium]